MTLGVEGVVDGAVDREKTLRGSGRLEALHLSFSSSDRLMRVLGSIVLPEALFMLCRQPEFTERRGVGSQLVGDDNPRREALRLQELAHQLQRGSTVVPGPDQEIQNLTFAIHGTPQVHPLSSNRNIHLVEVPSIIGLRPRPSKPLGVEVSELRNPPPDCFIGDVDPSFRQQFLDIPTAERKSQVEPDCILDDQGRKTMTAIGELLHRPTVSPGRRLVSR